MNDKWLRVDLKIAPELTDALSNFLTESGAEGVYQEALVSSYPDSEEEIHYESLTAYLPWEKQDERITSLESYLDDLKRIFPDLEKPAFIKKEITEPDWEEEWKKYFHPFRIGKKIVIKPTWEAYSPSDGDVVIEMDPGMAFGTGQHHSTAMCLEAMEDIFLNNETASWKILDVGTGTGILGIAAATLGAGQILCLDIDKNAVGIACDNAVLNQVGDKMEIRNGDISFLQRPFELILANLTAKVLVSLADDLERLLSSRGYLIISGIIEQNRKEIEDCFTRPSLARRRIIAKEEWLCYVFTKE